MPLISQRFVDGLPLDGSGVRHADTKLPRFYVRQGSRSHSFFIQFELHGKTQYFNIGKSTIKTADEARAEAKVAFGMVANGKDPRAEKRKQDTLPGDEWGDLAKAFIHHQRTRKQPRKQRTIEDYERYLLRTDHVPLQTNVRAITREDVGAWAIACKSRHTEYVARQFLQNVSSFLSWAAAHGKIEENPVPSLMRIYDKPQPRDRILSDAELKLLWMATEGQGGDYSAIVRLLCLTGCRLREISLLEKSEVINDRIEFRSERVKNGETHVVHLSAPTSAILAAVPDRDSDFVFGTDGTGKGFQGESKGQRSLRKRMDALLDHKANEALRETIRERVAKQGHWKPHDLRRTAYTVLSEEMLVGDRVLDWVFNHAKKGLKKNYDQTGQKRPCADPTRLEIAAGEALNDWAKYVMEAVNS